MNGGNRIRRRKNGLSPYFALSIAGHLLLIAALGFIGLKAKPEIAERLPFRVGLAMAQAPEAVPSPEPAAMPAREPQPVVERRSEPRPEREPVREERTVEPVAEAQPTPVQETAPIMEPVSAPVETPVAATFEPVESPVDLPSREIVSPPAEPDPALTQAYLEHISDMVDGAKRYPPLAMRRRLQGRVMVSATLDSGGGVIEASIAEDPDPLLSEAALKALRNAAPFGPLPEGRETLEVSVPVRFRLTR